MGEPRPNPKCPKCRGSDLDLEEFSTIGMLFHLCPDGKIRRSWGGGTEPDFLRVVAMCRTCKHQWHLKGEVQLLNYEGFDCSNHELCDD